MTSPACIAEAPEARPLAGRVALITGSTSGIGLGIARALAAKGADVVLNGFGDPKDIADVQASIAQSFGVLAHYSGADLSKADAIAQMFDEITATGPGRLDILVNNAGIQYVAPVTEFPPAKWDQILALNLTAAFHTMRLAIPLMRQGGYGRIINIASAHGLVASPFKSAYVAAKHGLIGLTKNRRARDGGRADHLQRRLPGLCLHPARGAPDRGPGQGPRHRPRGGDPRRAPGPAAQQAFRHRRGDGRADRLPLQPRRHVDHRRGLARRWRLDRPLNEATDEISQNHARAPGG